MDLYQIFVDLRPGVRDLNFAAALDFYLGGLKREGRIEGWRLIRRKLGLGPDDLGEFQILIETRDLAQLDEAFKAAAARAEPVESAHHRVNAMAATFKAALYRDFPDGVRQQGQEKF